MARELHTCGRVLPQEGQTSGAVSMRQRKVTGTSPLVRGSFTRTTSMGEAPSGARAPWSEWHRDLAVGRCQIRKKKEGNHGPQKEGVGTRRRHLAPSRARVLRGRGYGAEICEH